MSKNDRAVFGRISSVFIEDDNGQIYVSVVTGPNREPRRMIFSSPKPGVWYVPQEGDIVEVHNINGTKVAKSPANPPSGFGIPADLGEGDICFRLNQNTELHFSVQGDGTVDVNITADGEIGITSDSEVKVNAPSVKVGTSGGSYKPLAREGDPISGTDSTGGSISGQISSGSSSVQSS